MIHFFLSVSFLLFVVIVFHSHNDAPPAPQRNVSMTAVRGAIRPSTCALFTYLTYSYTIFICLCVYGGGCVAGWVCAVEFTIHDLFIREAR